MSFQFYGSSVSIVGSQRPNHGLAQTQLDKQVYPVIDYKSQDSKFGQVLFSANVEPGLHTISMTNEQDDFFLDVDWVSSVVCSIVITP